MSGYLWGVAHLVNDPSNELLEAIQKRLFKIEINKPPGNDIEKKSTETIAPLPTPRRKETAIDTTDLESNLKAIRSQNLRSQHVQVGKVPPVKKEKSLQCRCTTHTACKSTSVQKINYTDHSCGSQNLIMKDEHASPRSEKICQAHKETLLLLQQWTSVDFNRKKKKRYLRNLMKSMIHNIVNYFNVQKIEPFSQYPYTEKEKMQLFRCASIHKIENKSRKYYF
ncbi:PREDICTED: uncharacterized protein LOC106128305 [Papilio xuthus]|uniref:Uncharacterized protein LOC106128305 n=1 Tax=Papilio xuthus TaxID=66420 RepID=A0AAJ6ZYK3_PAPXU|nr:PREDICTED: uncharacterized protein LOC106128305 [Papilio xuthus]